ncbi:hypothetical protein SAMN04489761_3390 [Tenacibaculum sp. MAR_2009_124]|uniref:hypothetical protein n=1 Tax=Tenacibaculum sp. MAR_2009_124 TaxID=1250059 RepID=UPI00089AC59D|nr:hypothetical protein [Tenacibaculum sp. MAR_2009_124]SEC64756.1 hypothetical protein SAMN04489761_3390 [Tenacibaculum sp. MAR_2009_124]
MEKKKYIARELYQAQHNWMVWVNLGEYDTEEEAENLANNIDTSLYLENDNLYLYFKNSIKMKTFTNGDIEIQKLKDKSLDKIICDDTDYQTMNIKISEIKNYPDLACGFSSIGYEVVKTVINQLK